METSVMIFIDKYEKTIRKVYNLANATDKIMYKFPRSPNNYDIAFRIRRETLTFSIGTENDIRSWEKMFGEIYSKLQLIYHNVIARNLKTNIDTFINLRPYLTDDNNIKQIIDYKIEMEIQDGLKKQLNRFIKETDIFIDFMNKKYERHGIDLLEKIPLID